MSDVLGADVPLCPLIEPEEAECPLPLSLAVDASTYTGNVLSPLQDAFSKLS